MLTILQSTVVAETTTTVPTTETALETSTSTSSAISTVSAVPYISTFMESYPVWSGPEQNYADYATYSGYLETEFYGPSLLRFMCDGSNASPTFRGESYSSGAECNTGIQCMRVCLDINTRYGQRMCQAMNLVVDHTVFDAEYDYSYDVYACDLLYSQPLGPSDNADNCGMSSELSNGFIFNDSRWKSLG